MEENKSKRSAGKGDKPRKYSKAKYDSNYDQIKWRSKLCQNLLINCQLEKQEQEQPQ